MAVSSRHQYSTNESVMLCNTLLHFINQETGQPISALSAYRELIVQLSKRVQELTQSSDALLNSFAPSSAID